MNARSLTPKLLMILLLFCPGALSAVKKSGPAEIRVIETRLPSGDSKIRVTDPRGKVAATYKINLSTHHHPATDANNPLIRAVGVVEVRGVRVFQLEPVRRPRDRHQQGPEDLQPDGVGPSSSGSPRSRRPEWTTPY